MTVVGLYMGQFGGRGGLVARERRMSRAKGNLVVGQEETHPSSLNVLSGVISQLVFCLRVLECNLTDYVW